MSNRRPRKVIRIKLQWAEHESKERKKDKCGEKKEKKKKLGTTKGQNKQVCFWAVKVGCQDVSELLERKPTVVPAVVKLKMMEMSKQNPSTYPTFWQSQVYDINSFVFFFLFLPAGWKKRKRNKCCWLLYQRLAQLTSNNQMTARTRSACPTAPAIDLSVALAAGRGVWNVKYSCMRD